MTSPVVTPFPLVQGLEEVFAGNPNDAMQSLRQKSWSRFSELGLPQKNVEAFQYARFSTLYESSFSTDVELDAPVEIQFPGTTLVFVNGQYSEALSSKHLIPSQVVILPLAQAMRSYGAFLNQQWTKSLSEENDPFAALNGAMHRQGAFIYVPPRLALVSPIHIVHVIRSSKESPVMAHPRLHIFMGAQSEATVIASRLVPSGVPFWLNSVIECALEEGSNLRYAQTIADNDSGWSFEAIRATQKRSSVFKTSSVNIGGNIVRNDYRVLLMGEGAEVFLNGLSRIHGKQQAHNHILIEHAAPQCESLQLFKCCLDDVSESSFEGKILVRQAAQKTKAFQLNQNLLLSNNATAHSKPNLEIFADDVKASHGATFGQLDPEQVFYMRTRGFSPAQAKSVLVDSFCYEVIQTIPHAKLAEDLVQQLKRVTIQ